MQCSSRIRGCPFPFRLLSTFPSDRQKEVGDNGAAKGRALETGDTKFDWQVTTSPVSALLGSSEAMPSPICRGGKTGGLPQVYP